MRPIRYVPAPPLDAFVECFWWSERASPLEAAECMLPTGAAYLVFPLHDAPLACRAPTGESLVWRHAIVHGPQSRFYLAGPKPAGAVAGIAFRPGAAGALLGIPASEIADDHVPLDALWGAGAETLHQRLCEAATACAIFRILEEELLARLRQPLLIHPAVAHALARSSGLRVEDVRREVDLSPRHFIALFRAAVGTTPGRFYRIRRFGRVLRALARGGPRNLADLAAALSYADQSHLIREFKEHAGVTPTQYRPLDQESPHHHAPAAPTGKKAPRRAEDRLS